MSRKELDQAIHRVDRTALPVPTSPELPPNQQGDTVCYDTQGLVAADDINCAAKFVKDRFGRVRHFVKWCLEGPDKGHLLNPYSIYYRDGDDRREAARRGQRRYEFKPVTESAFNHYLRFLKTRTYVFCQAAEREILDG